MLSHQFIRLDPCLGDSVGPEAGTFNGKDSQRQQDPIMPRMVFKYGTRKSG